jgi:hypothetical protein
MRFLQMLGWIFLITINIQFSGCGGGSGGSSSDNSGEILTGRFIDSPVCGLTYYTDTLEGTTDENGNFQYRRGETVVFGLGDLEFPAVTAAQILTPLELAGVESVNDKGVENMARLLQTLDNDCDPTNGIVISGQVLLAATGMAIDFESDSFDEDVQGLIAAEGAIYSTCEQLVDASDAIAHLEETLNDLNDQENPPIGDGYEGKLGVWEGEGQQDGLSWTIKITLAENESLIEYPSLECGGTLTLLVEEDAQLLFREDITYGMLTATECGCIDNGFVELTDQNDDSLIYRWYYPDEDSNQGDLGAIGTVTRSE